MAKRSFSCAMIIAMMTLTLLLALVTADYSSTITTTIGGGETKFYATTYLSSTTILPSITSIKKWSLSVNDGPNVPIKFDTAGYDVFQLDSITKPTDIATIFSTAATGDVAMIDNAFTVTPTTVLSITHPNLYCQFKLNVDMATSTIPLTLTTLPFTLTITWESKDGDATVTTDQVVTFAANVIPFKPKEAVQFSPHKTDATAFATFDATTTSSTDYLATSPFNMYGFVMPTTTITTTPTNDETTTTTTTTTTITTTTAATYLDVHKLRITPLNIWALQLVPKTDVTDPQPNAAPLTCTINGYDVSYDDLKLISIGGDGAEDATWFKSIEITLPTAHRDMVFVANNTVNFDCRYIQFYNLNGEQSKTTKTNLFLYTRQQPLQYTIELITTSTAPAVNTIVDSFNVVNIQVGKYPFFPALSTLSHVYPGKTSSANSTYIKADLSMTFESTVEGGYNPLHHFNFTAPTNITILATNCISWYLSNFRHSHSTEASYPTNDDYFLHLEGYSLNNETNIKIGREELTVGFESVFESAGYDPTSTAPFWTKLFSSLDCYHQLSTSNTLQHTFTTQVESINPHHKETVPVSITTIKYTPILPHSAGGISAWVLYDEQNEASLFAFELFQPHWPFDAANVYKNDELHIKVRLHSGQIGFATSTDTDTDDQGLLNCHLVKDSIYDNPGGKPVPLDIAVYEIIGESDQTSFDGTQSVLITKENIKPHYANPLKFVLRRDPAQTEAYAVLTNEVGLDAKIRCRGVTWFSTLGLDIDQKFWSDDIVYSTAVFRSNDDDRSIGYDKNSYAVAAYYTSLQTWHHIGNGGTIAIVVTIICLLIAIPLLVLLVKKVCGDSTKRGKREATGLPFLSH